VEGNIKMKSTIIKSKQIIETEEPVLDLKLLKKKTNAKTPANLMLKYAKQFKKNKNFTMAILFQELYKQVKNMEISEEFKANQWRGSSGIDYQIKPDYIIAIRFRKRDIGEKPTKITLEIPKEEINKIRWAINQLNTKKLVRTRDIAEKAYNKEWHNIFSNRKQHILLVEILNYLEYNQEIKYYRSGKIKVLYQQKLKGGKKQNEI